jgi:hypothetical protein
MLVPWQWQSVKRCHMRAQSPAGYDNTLGIPQDRPVGSGVKGLERGTPKRKKEKERNQKPLAYGTFLAESGADPHA